MKPVFKEFVTSDWHLGSAAIIQQAQRPFKDLEHMHTALIANFNSMVTSIDTCYFLGDMVAGKCDKSLIEALNGTKILLLGNHDLSRPAMLRLGFDVVTYSITVYIHGERVTMSHCPLMGVYREPTESYQESARGNWHNELKNYRFSCPDNGQFHLHGHIHSSKHRPEVVTQTDRQWDIGVDGNHFKPVPFSAVESWILKEKQKGSTRIERL